MNTYTMNKVLLVRRNGLVLPKFTPTISNNRLAMTFQAECMNMGYILSEELTTMLSLMPEVDFVPWAEDVRRLMQEAKGINPLINRPLFPGFPGNMMDKDMAERLAIATAHYESDGTWTPDDETVCQELFSGDQKYAIVKLCFEKDYLDIMTNIMSAPTPFSPADQDDLAAFFSGSQALTAIPDNVPNKENVVFLCRLLRDMKVPDKVYANLLKTPTDVLRLAVAFSNGDITLKQNTKFGNMTRASRKLFLSNLERMAGKSSFLEDLNAYAGRWIRLAEKLHPGEYAKQYPKTYAAFTAIRNGDKVETFASKLETALASGNQEVYTKMLSSRPGIFARRLDHALRQAKEPQKVVDAFRSVASKVPTATLLQVREHFAHRADEGSSRVFFPKGNVSRSYTKEAVLSPLDEKVASAVVSATEIGLMAQYAQRPGLGNVYIAPEMKSYAVPNGTRTAAKALKTVARGSCFDISEGTQVLRPFIYWMNGDDRTDVDLSVLMMDKDFAVVEQVAYYNLQNRSGSVYHSGDITNAPNGAAEFVDIVLDEAVNTARYAAMVVTCFTAQPFKDLPICYGGWMSRSAPTSGEVFDPTTVDNKFDLTGNQVTDLVVVVDLEERKIYWADLACDASVSEYRVSANQHVTGIGAASKAIVEGHHANLYDVFKLNAMARGRLVDTPEEADTVISTDETATVKPTDTDIIVAEYL